MGTFVLGIILISGSGAVAADSQSTDVIQFIRAFFDEESSKPAEVAKVLEGKNKSSFAELNELIRLHFQPKDIWGNREYVFGYGILEDQSTVLFAWKTNADSPKMSLKELSGIYEDDRMASIQDEKDLKRWKRMREIVAGSFVGLRKQELKLTPLYPVKDGELKSSASELYVTEQPMVVRFSSAVAPKTKTALSNLVAIPTR
jgi:hypothetical protein